MTVMRHAWWVMCRAGREDGKVPQLHYAIDSNAGVIAYLMAFNWRRGGIDNAGVAFELVR